MEKVIEVLKEDNRNPLDYIFLLRSLNIEIREKNNLI